LVPVLSLSLYLSSTLHHLISLSFFFLKTPPPPISTLFPYTTLFRSYDSNTADFIAIVTRIVSDSCIDERRRRERFEREGALEVTDRKSTRLNSSHVSISYAVFCLKKKKRKQEKSETKGKINASDKIE